MGTVHLTSKYRYNTLDEPINGYTAEAYCGNENIRMGDALYDVSYLEILEETSIVCEQCRKHPDLPLELLKRLTDEEGK